MRLQNFNLGFSKSDISCRIIFLCQALYPFGKPMRTCRTETDNDEYLRYTHSGVMYAIDLYNNLLSIYLLSIFSCYN